MEQTTSHESEQSHIPILRVLDEMPFAGGKKLIIDILKGNEKNKSIQKNKLHQLKSFNSFKVPRENIESSINTLVQNGHIEITNTQANTFHKILKLTEKGKQELENPTLQEKKLSSHYHFVETPITEIDTERFAALKMFLNQFNNKQKKAIIEQNKQCVCVAGPGSGKTTVLTKRIEFLTKYQNVPPEKILAITFTRKARQEMQRRLHALGISPSIETFNSFAEKILQRHGSKIYSRPVRMMHYGEKIMAIMNALEHQNKTVDEALALYFTPNQQYGKTREQRMHTFMNDCFFILEYYKTKKRALEDFSKDRSGEEKDAAELVYKTCQFLQKHMQVYGLRDYTDQILDTATLFQEYADTIPQYDHILVDEYQDVNEMQTILLDLLNPQSIFVVGDPRQSIFGWRGSDIHKILHFKKKCPDASTIILDANYRSGENIISFFNNAIKSLNLPDIEPATEEKGTIEYIECDSEDEERKHIIAHIKSTTIPREEIFILARTNRQLKELSEKLHHDHIPHIVKNEDTDHIEARPGQLTLSTIHGIKGLEAHTVIIMGCNQQNFPSKTTDHPIIEMIKIDEYDKEEEEKRVFYVALSRAKRHLLLTYTGKPTYFITKEMEEIIQNDQNSTLV